LVVQKSFLPSPIEGNDNIEAFFVEDLNGTLLFGPYKREQDAKGVLTRLRNKHIG
jgi:hypothetical protein